MRELAGYLAPPIARAAMRRCKPPSFEAIARATTSLATGAQFKTNGRANQDFFRAARSGRARI